MKLGWSKIINNVRKKKGGNYLVVDSHAENIVIKENWYDLSKYKDEIARYVTTDKF